MGIKWEVGINGGHYRSYVPHLLHVGEWGEKMSLMGRGACQLRGNHSTKEGKGEGETEEWREGEMEGNGEREGEGMVQEVHTRCNIFLQVVLHFPQEYKI